MTTFPYTQPTIAFDPSASVSPTAIVTLSGTARDNFGPVQVELYDSSSDLGAAQVNPLGAWTFSASMAPGSHEYTAVATDLAGNQNVAQSSFTLVTGIVGKSYAFQEIYHDTSGDLILKTNLSASGGVVSQSVFGADGNLLKETQFGSDGSPLSHMLTNANGTHTITGDQPGILLHSVGNDYLTGQGGHTQFIFGANFGRDEVTNFTATGSAHDVLSIPKQRLGTAAAVLNHTTSALDGSAVIHLSAHNTIKLDGVTKAQLVTHHQDFEFHA